MNMQHLRTKPRTQHDHYFDLIVVLCVCGRCGDGLMRHKIVVILKLGYCSSCGQVWLVGVDFVSGLGDQYNVCHSLPLPSLISHIAIYNS